MSRQQQLMLHLNSLNRSGNNGGVGVGVASLQLEENCYICPQCFRSYRRHGTLRRHLRQECGKGKSMVCSVCGHRTKRADHLRQHVRKRHPELGMRILFNNGNNAPTTAATTATDVNSVSTTAAPAETLGYFSN
uniref:C2H2-type domain-containing protein n=1 Tax=Megaselia scalaris TaxID=36166 RepID=T1GIC0_MEGSC